MVSAERQEWQERSLSDSDPRHWIQQALRIDVQPLSDELLELLMHRWVNIQILTHRRGEAVPAILRAFRSRNKHQRESSHLLLKTHKTVNKRQKAHQIFVDLTPKASRASSTN